MMVIQFGAAYRFEQKHLPAERRTELNRMQDLLDRKQAEGVNAAGVDVARPEGFIPYVLTNEGTDQALDRYHLIQLIVAAQKMNSRLDADESVTIGLTNASQGAWAGLNRTLDTLA